VGGKNLEVRGGLYSTKPIQEAMFFEKRPWVLGTEGKTPPCNKLGETSKK